MLDWKEEAPHMRWRLDLVGAFYVIFYIDQDDPSRSRYCVENGNHVDEPRELGLFKTLDEAKFCVQQDIQAPLLGLAMMGIPVPITFAPEVDSDEKPGDAT